MKCRLCGGHSLAFIANTARSSMRYGRCVDCGYVQVAPAHFISRTAEKERYVKHDNHSSSRGYREYLSIFLDQAVFPFTPSGGSVLDYGSGPHPLLSRLLREKGYTVDIYDPIFAPTRAWRLRHYDAVVLHEVAEHLRDPGATFSKLLLLLNPRGILAIRTRFLPREHGDFGQWWYRMDSTHVGFFSPECLENTMRSHGARVLFSNPPDTTVVARH